MQIPSAQIEFKKMVGKAKNKDVWHVKTRGGLHMIADSTGRVIGSGPHRAVARHIAQRMEPDLVWTELSKSDHYDISDYSHLLPHWESVTQRIQSLQDE